MNKSTWLARQDKVDGIKAEFEATFEGDDGISEFSYRIRGVYLRKSDGDFKKTREKAPPDVVRNLTRALEESAEASKAKIDPGQD